MPRMYRQLNAEATRSEGTCICVDPISTRCIHHKNQTMKLGHLLHVFFRYRRIMFEYEWLMMLSAPLYPS